MGASQTRASRRAKKRWQNRRRLVARGLALLGAVVIGLPVLLTLVYTVVPPVSTLMLRDLALLRGYDRDWISLEEATPVLLHSIIASEDQTFCSHHGVEWGALRDQFDRWRAGEDARGASTLSMQVARNLFLWQGRSTVRKALEAPLAVLVDLVWSKRRMIEIYINIAELRPQVYGFEAAAQTAFGRPAADISRRQAALLVAALPLPSERNAAQPTSRQSRLAETIQVRARGMGAYIGCLTVSEG